MSQLGLPIKLDDNAVFETYYPGHNQNLINFLKNLTLAKSYIPSCWLWGQRSVGKSHLLQAVCERFQDNAIFLPMEDIISEDSSILDGSAALISSTTLPSDSRSEPQMAQETSSSCSSSY